MTFIDYLNIVLKHKLTLIISTIACTFLGITACFLIPKVYESNGKLLISQDNMSFMNNGSPLEDIMLRSLGKSDPLTTQMEILKTRPITTKIIDTLGLKNKDGIALQPEVFLSRFNFNIVRNTNLIEVKSKSFNPDSAALYVNTLMQVFVEKNQQLNQEMISTAKEFIKKQLVEQKLKVEEAEQGLVTFKEKTNIMSLDKETEVNIIAYSNLNIELIKVSGELNAALNQQKFYKEKLDTKNSTNNPLYSTWITSAEQVENVVIGLNAKKLALEKKLLLQKNLMKDAPIIEAQLISLLREQRISNEIYTGLLSKFEEYKIQEAAKIGSAKIIEPAISTIKPVFPKKKIIVILSFILGICVGITILFAKEYFKDLPHSIDDVKKTIGDSILGTIPYQALSINPLFVYDTPDSIMSEAIRLIQTSMKFKLPANNKGSVILITSAQPGEGKSTVAANLAYSYSSSKKTLLMNMDFRKPSLDKIFKIKINTVGISDTFDNTTDFMKALQKVGTLNLIDSGPLPPNPLDLAQSKKIDSLIEELRNIYEIIIIDTAPITMIAETLELLRLADTVAIVVDMSGISLRNLKAIKATFEARNISPGIIVNKLRIAGNSYYRYKK